ncbi:MAG: hypothetical protein OXM01_01375 [Gemmatimonadota bacterium]|nr:hypothetical protein [Gemmatimonadota bacterium]
MSKSKQSDRRKVELVKSAYQPNKAELEADTRIAEGGPITLDGLAKAAKGIVQSVDVRWLRRPPR